MAQASDGRDAQSELKKQAKAAYKNFSAMDTVKAMDKALLSVTTQGLSRFIPQKRLWQGEHLVLEPRSGPRPWLHNIGDEKKIGNKCINYLLYSVGIRGYDSNDPCHRDWNDAHDAVTATGLLSHLAWDCKLIFEFMFEHLCFSKHVLCYACPSQCAKA